MRAPIALSEMVMSDPTDRERLIERLRAAASACLFEVGCERTPGGAGRLYAEAAAALAVPPEPPGETLQHIDMLMADRLRNWADRIGEYGPNVQHWTSTKWLVDEMRRIASGIEDAIKAAPRPTPEGRETVASEIRRTELERVIMERGPAVTADFLRGAQHVIVGQPKRETTEAALLAAYMAAGLTASEAYIEIIRQLHLALEAV